MHPCVLSFDSSEKTWVICTSQCDVENEGRSSRSAGDNVKRREGWEAADKQVSGRRETGPVNGSEMPSRCGGRNESGDTVSGQRKSVILRTREKQVGYH